MKVLVTGATGLTGKYIVNSLCKLNYKIVTFSRNTIDNDILDSEHRVGDLYSNKDLDSLLKDIDFVYHIPPNMNKDEIELSSNLLKYVIKYNIIHFIYHSVIHPNIKNLVHHWNKLKVEELIIRSGVNYTIFQPSSYMQNIFNDVVNIKNNRIHYIPYSIASKLSLVDLNDVSNAAAKVIGRKEHFFAKYELAGPQMLSGLDKSKILSEVLNKNIIVEQEPLEKLTNKLIKMNVNENIIKMRIEMFKYYNDYGLPGNSTILENLLNKKPTTFKKFLLKNKSKFI